MRRPAGKRPGEIALPILLGSAILLLVTAAAAPSCIAQPTEEADDAGTVVIEPVGNEMKFATEEITAKAGTRLKLVMNNTATNDAMHHNVAVLELEVGDDEGIEEVGMAALQAGEARGFIPDHDALVAYTPMAAPGERTEVEFTVPPPGDYPYVCLFPGHYTLMRGVLHATP